MRMERGGRGRWVIYLQRLGVERKSLEKMRKIAFVEHLESVEPVGMGKRDLRMWGLSEV
jgi:hypothetical protein